MRIITGTTTKYYYLKDHLGSIRVVVNESGEIVSSDDYDPWGMILNGRSTNVAYLNSKYKFTGKERDNRTGYDYFGARYYDSRIGRWSAVDPLFEKYAGVSPYTYVLDNPVRLIDPDGMQLGGEPSYYYRMQEIVVTARQWWKEIADINFTFGAEYQTPGNEMTYQIYTGTPFSGLETTTEWMISGFESLTGWEVPGLAKDILIAGSIPGMRVPGLSGATIEKSLEYAMKGSKFIHLFKEKHLLGPLIEQLGGEKKFLETVIKSVARENLAPGKFSIVKNIGGTNLTIKGFIDTNKTIKLGTIFKH